MNTSEDCPFCRIQAGELPATIVLETSEYLCIEDKYPVTDGHTLVFPKSHVQLLTDADTTGLYEVLELAADTVRDQYDPDGMNIGLNDGPAAGQTVPHLHWHIIPRYEGDIADPTGGVRGVIPEERIYDADAEDT